MLYILYCDEVIIFVYEYYIIICCGGPRKSSFAAEWHLKPEWPLSTGAHTLSLISANPESITAVVTTVSEFTSIASAERVRRGWRAMTQPREHPIDTEWVPSLAKHPLPASPHKESRKSYSIVRAAALKLPVNVQIWTEEHKRSTWRCG